MIDCGESTQTQMRKSRISFSGLKHIFISHLHGDHCFGLPGLISTLGMLGRSGDLYIHAPSGIEEFLRPILTLFNKELPYKIQFNTIDPYSHSLILDDRSLEIYTIPLKHRVIPLIEGADLLYHEATFAETEAKRAKETFHSTARQAAEIARRAQVKKLVIGHYSARYENITPLLQEAREIFPETVSANEGMKLSI